MLYSWRIVNEGKDGVISMFSLRVQKSHTREEVIQLNQGQAESHHDQDMWTESEEVGPGVETSRQYIEAVFRLVEIEAEADTCVEKSAWRARQLRHAHIFNALCTVFAECSLTR